MKTIIIPTAALAVLTLGLAGCASSDADTTDGASAGASTSPSASHDEMEHSEATATEVDAPVSRLTVAHEGGVSVLELAGDTLEPVGEVAVDGHFRANAGADGRYVYLANSEAGTVQIVDAGAYAEPHGEHYHYYVTEPALLDDALTGANPVHVVGHAGQVAVFYDDSGAVDIIDEASVATGTMAVSQQSADFPHHGVAVPLEGGLVLTEAAEGESLPASVRQTDSAGESVALYEDICPGLHGETMVDEVVYFGCTTGVATVNTSDKSSGFITYPADAAEGRIGTFYGTEDVLAAPWDEDTIVLLDTAHESFTFVDVEGTIGTVARGAHDEVLVLTTDGMLAVLDESGEELAHISAIGEFELPEGHGGVRPAIAVLDETIVISDPNASTLELVDGDEWALLSTVGLDAAPTALVATGGSMEDAHAHEEEAVEEDHDHGEHAEDGDHDEDEAHDDAHDHDNEDHDDHDH
ncbi:hypothetical protein [Demequina flava]|uniref:hypothetical protein n=1 Tax=Demequina flava TaxID=1095025 RepID=UPI0007825545|nr:hypothetical protein [Demequina flava]